MLAWIWLVVWAACFLVNVYYLRRYLKNPKHILAVLLVAALAGPLGIIYMIASHFLFSKKAAS